MKKGKAKNILSTLQTPNKPIYMQKWLWAASAVVLIIILFLVFRPSGPGEAGTKVTSAGEYIVEITGTYAIGYKGQIISGPNTLDIQGIILKPVVYTVQGSPIIVNLQKPGQTGTVNVVIKRGNTVLKEGTASGSYGTVNLTASYY